MGLKKKQELSIDINWLSISPHGFVDGTFKYMLPLPEMSLKRFPGECGMFYIKYVVSRKSELCAYSYDVFSNFEVGFNEGGLLFGISLYQYWSNAVYLSILFIFY